MVLLLVVLLALLVSASHSLRTQTNYRHCYYSSSSVMLNKPIASVTSWFSMSRLRPCHSTTVNTETSKSELNKNPQDDDDNNNNMIDLLYDSECPLCNMEVEFLRKRDIHHRIRFTDLSSADYDPSQHGNIDFVDGMRKIRAILPDKTVVTGMEVFRRTYEAIGLGWIFALTRLPVVGLAADALYDIWAENRLRITGRGELADVLRARAVALRNLESTTDCDDTCDLDLDD